MRPRPGGRAVSGISLRSFFSFDDVGFGARQQRRQPRKGRDVHFEMEVPFEQALRGGKRTISIPVETECPKCHGSGAKPGSKVETCSRCGGSGNVSFNQGAFTVKRPCPRCLGRGTIVSTPCPQCKGTGQVRRSRRIEVKIPAGVADGQTIRLKGQGGRSESGGPPGDIYITCRVGEHPFFKRDGMDIHSEIPINIAQAALGARVQVKTVNGRTIELKIPAGTNSGTRFRLKGQGLKKDGRVGDQYVVVKVLTPSLSNGRDRELFEEFAKEHGLSW
jgi:molecular chaperone DnaJ